MKRFEHLQQADSASESNDHRTASFHYGEAAKEAIDAGDFVAARLHLKWAWVHAQRANLKEIVREELTAVVARQVDERLKP